LLSYDRLSRKPLLFKSFTGLTVEQFNNIYRKIEKRYDEYELHRLSKRKKKRERKVGSGRRFKLDVKNRFLMLLVYYRLYITYTLAGYLFNLDQSNVCRDIQKIENLIRKCLPILDKIYKRITKRLQTIEEIKEYYPDLIAFIDSTEQQIPRPKDRQRRKMYYSGKKKRHTVKNQMMTSNHGLIIHKPRHTRGRIHDYDIYKKNHPDTPKEVENVFDLGYLGVEKDFPKQLSSLPIKKKKNQELTLEERVYNKIHSKKRITVEHTICRIKKYKIMSDVFRNRLRKYDKVSDIVSGLVNYRIMNPM
jgi:hypothetical protein